MGLIRILPLSALAILLSVNMACTEERNPGVIDQEILVQGESRTFRLVIPAKGTQEKRMPLVIALHGGGTNGRSMERFSGLDDAADKHGFIVIYPDGSGRKKRILTWNSGSCCGFAKNKNVDDVGFIRALIELLVARYGADPARVYVTGISNGAMMAYRLAAEIPDRIAAVAAVAGTLEIDPALIRAPVPVLHFHGTADPYVPFEGGRGPRSAEGLQFRSVPDTIAVWVRAAGADPEPEVEELLDLQDDGTRVIRYSYGTNEDPQRVVLYKIVGGGHTWPGRPKAERVLGRATLEVSANDLMWEFFRRHARIPTSRDLDRDKERGIMPESAEVPDDTTLHAR
ncbi:MAG: alpha/beta fold hydrolase [bacterium]